MEPEIELRGIAGHTGQVREKASANLHEARIAFFT